MKLYWVTTEDHDEDWFVVASTENEASVFHEKMEGYNPGEAKAEELLCIPKHHIQAEIGWPSEELLLANGATFISIDEPRVVEFGGRKFFEGMLGATINEINDDIFERDGLGRLNKTIKPLSH